MPALQHGNLLAGALTIAADNPHLINLDQGFFTQSVNLAFVRMVGILTQTTWIDQASRKPL